MASLPSHFYYFAFLLLSLFLLCHCSHVNGGEEQSHHVISVRSLRPSKVCSSPKGSDPDPAKLRVVNRYGPCAPPNHKRKKPTHSQILLQDQSRVDSLHYRISNSLSTSASTIPARSGILLGTGNYIVTVGLGTPKRDFSVIFDTGSPLTWVQCKPCAGFCHPQQEPIFDPVKSSTYLNISCNSAECTQLKLPKSCFESTCIYVIQYGDGSLSIGFLAHDTLTLSSTDVFPKFTFGCGEQNEGLFGKTAGLLGLSRDPVSLVSQASKKYGGVFSYCLPRTSSSTGYLTFGGGASSSAAVKFTPMLTEPKHPSFYFLELNGIAVGNQQLSIPSTVFSTPGTIIDSGTVITRLPPAAYSALRSAFREMMSKYPMAPAFAILDTCYNFNGYKTVTVPKVALQFRGGVTVDLDFLGTLYVLNVSRVCLAFAGNQNAGQIGIIGNVQQRTMEVVYDVSKKMIGFGAGGCN